MQHSQRSLSELSVLELCALFPCVEKSRQSDKMPHDTMPNPGPEKP